MTSHFINSLLHCAQVNSPQVSWAFAAVTLLQPDYKIPPFSKHPLAILSFTPSRTWMYCPHSLQLKLSMLRAFPGPPCPLHMLQEHAGPSHHGFCLGPSGDRIPGPPRQGDNALAPRQPLLLGHSLGGQLGPALALQAPTTAWALLPCLSLEECSQATMAVGCFAPESLRDSAPFLSARSPSS